MRPRHLLTVLLAAILATCSVAAEPFSGGVANAAGRSLERQCRITVGAETQGLYVARGSVRCSTAQRILRAVGRGAGTSVDNNVSKYDGWYCGGRMGYYFCRTQRPYGGRVRKEFLTRSCSPATPGCPRRIKQ